MNKAKDTILNLLSLLVIFSIYSSTSIFMKLASYEKLITYDFFIYFVLSIIVLGIYAILWQLILKKIPLTIAYTSKSITVIITLLISRFIFNESISINNLLGAILIILGAIFIPYSK